MLLESRDMTMISLHAQILQFGVFLPFQFACPTWQFLAAILTGGTRGSVSGSPGTRISYCTFSYSLHYKTFFYHIKYQGESNGR